MLHTGHARTTYIHVELGGHQGAATAPLPTPTVHGTTAPRAKPPSSGTLRWQGRQGPGRQNRPKLSAIVSGIGRF